MKRRLTIVIVCIILSFSGYGQVFLDGDSYKFTVTTDIFKRITYGYSSAYKIPKLYISKTASNGRQYIATYFPGDDPKIIIDERLYDLCTSFRSDSLNALASVIGHELAHYFSGHKSCQDFASINNGSDEAEKVLSNFSVSEILNIEEEADLIGSFYGYLAGYSTYRMFPLVLDTIYKYYNLPEEIEGYPSKLKRKEIAMKAQLEIDDWLDILECSNFLWALGELEASKKAYEFLSTKFPGKEIFNNIAVLDIYKALTLSNHEELIFSLPLEIDAETRLKKGGQRGAADKSMETQRRKLLEEAIEILDKVIESDSEYWSARVNKASALIMLGRYIEAELAIQPLFSKVNNDIESDLFSSAIQVKGISSYYRGRFEDAIMYFEMAIRIDNTAQSNYNLSIARKYQSGLLDNIFDYNLLADAFSGDLYPLEQIANPDTERIKGKTVSGVLEADSFKTLCISETAILKSAEYNDYEQGILCLGDSRINYIKVNSCYNGSTSKGITIGTPKSDIKSIYGRPSYTLDKVNGCFFVYRKRGLVFDIDKNGFVKNWIVYLKK